MGFLALFIAIFEFVADQVPGVLTGIAAGMLSGEAGTMNVLGIGLVDDVVVWLLKNALSLSRWDVFGLQLFIDESWKLHEEANIYADEDDAQRHARHAALVRWHGDKAYLFGDFSYEDAALLAVSAYTVVNSGIPEAVFEAVSDFLPALV